MKTFYYYSRDNQNRPIITHCFLTDGATWARGTALCSIDDNPCKKTGKRIAFSRAMNAFFGQNVVTGYDIKSDRYFPKCEFMPDINTIERKFMGIISL